MLNQIWQLYTARDDDAFERHGADLRRRVPQIEGALGQGPLFAGHAFCLVGAAFAPVFRYFDVFDTFWQGHLFDQVPRACAWRAALSQRACARLAVRPDYPALLRNFVERQQGVLGALSDRERCARRRREPQLPRARWTCDNDRAATS